MVDIEVKEYIIIKFYDEYKKPSVIAKELYVRPSYVTKIIQKDSRYNKEKEARAKSQREKRKKYKSDWIRNKRNESKELDEFVKLQHEQASKELSYQGEISDIAFVSWNRSSYTYSKKSSDLVLKRKNVYTSDTPKRVRNVVPASSIKARKVYGIC